jgi:hypothetical protein
MQHFVLGASRLVIQAPNNDPSCLPSSRFLISGTANLGLIAMLSAATQAFPPASDCNQMKQVANPFNEVAA